MSKKLSVAASVFCRTLQNVEKREGNSGEFDESP